MIKIGNPLLRWAVRILVALTLAFIILMAGCYGCGKMIYAKRGCEEFQIDNTELHTGIDIPAKKDFECNYISSTKLKRSYFVIDKSKVAMEPYISFCKFKLLDTFSKISMHDFYRFNGDTLAQIENCHSIFYKEKSKANGEYYKALLDTATGRVWINLQYAD